MSTSVTLPALGESVTEGTVSRWLKQVGDTVEADEPLLEVSTDKVDTEIPSPASGVLLEIRAQEDETVEIGAVLAVIGEASEAEGGAGGGGGDDAPAESEPEQAEPAPVEPQPDPSSAADAEKMAEAEPESAPAAAASSGSDSGGESGSGGEAAAGTEVTLPALGESVTEGTVSRWLKQVGDSVEADEALLEVSTDKVDTEIPSPTSGTLLEIRVQEDETVEIGAVLAVIGDSGGAAQTESEPQPEAQPEPEPEAEQAPEPEPEPEAKQAPEPEPGARAGARAGCAARRGCCAPERRR